MSNKTSLMKGVFELFRRSIDRGSEAARQQDVLSAAHRQAADDTADAEERARAARAELDRLSSSRASLVADRDRLARRLEQLQQSSQRDEAALQKVRKDAAAAYATAVRSGDTEAESQAMAAMSEAATEAKASAGLAGAQAVIQQEIQRLDKGLADVEREEALQRAALSAAECAAAEATWDAAVNVLAVAMMKVSRVYEEHERIAPEHVQRAQVGYFETARAVIGGVSGVHTGAMHTLPVLNMAHAKRAARDLAVSGAVQEALSA